MKYLTLILFPALLLAVWDGDTLGAPYFKGEPDTTNASFQKYVTDHAGEGGGVMSGDDILDSLNNKDRLITSQWFFNDTLWVCSGADTFALAWVYGGKLYIAAEGLTEIDSAEVSSFIRIVSGSDTIVWNSDSIYSTKTLKWAGVADSALAVTISKITGTKLDDFTAPDDNTDLDASTDAHGLLPKLPDNGNLYLNGTGEWSSPSGGGGSSIDTFVMYLDPYWSGASQNCDSILHQFTSNGTNDQFFASIDVSLPCLMDTHRVVLDSIIVPYYTGSTSDSLKMFFMKKSGGSSAVRQDSSAKVCAGAGAWSTVNVLANGDYTMQDSYGYWLWMRGYNSNSSGIRIDQSIRIVYHVTIE